MSRVLVISPHPDDESIGCGGTLLDHAANGDAVRVVFLTSGEAGGHGRSAEATRRLREREAQAAAEILDVQRIDFWREPDGALQPGDQLVARLCAELSSWRPDVVYVTHARELHDDHRAAHQIVVTAVYERSFDGPRPVVRTYEIWTPVQEIEAVVDISPYIDRKVAAIRAHASQCSIVRFDEAAPALNRYRGELYSWPGGPYAEVFGKTSL